MSCQNKKGATAWPNGGALKLSAWTEPRPSREKSRRRLPVFQEQFDLDRCGYGTTKCKRQDDDVAEFRGDVSCKGLQLGSGNATECSRMITP